MRTPYPAKFIFCWFKWYVGLGVLLFIPIATLVNYLLSVLLQHQGYGGEVDFVGAFYWMSISYITISLLSSALTFHFKPKLTKKERGAFLLLSFFSFPTLLMLTLISLIILRQMF